MSKTLSELGKELKGERWKLNELNNYVSEFLGFEIEFQELETETSDYRIGIDLLLDDETLVYVDVYYLRDRDDNMLITKYSFDNDDMLNNVDLNKKIKGVVSYE